MFSSADPKWSNICMADKHNWVTVTAGPQHTTVGKLRIWLYNQLLVTLLNLQYVFVSLLSLKLIIFLLIYL